MRTVSSISSYFSATGLVTTGFVAIVRFQRYPMFLPVSAKELENQNLRAPMLPTLPGQRA